MLGQQKNLEDWILETRSCLSMEPVWLDFLSPPARASSRCPLHSFNSYVYLCMFNYLYHSIIIFFCSFFFLLVPDASPSLDYQLKQYCKNEVCLAFFRRGSRTSPGSSWTLWDALQSPPCLSEGQTWDTSWGSVCKTALWVFAKRNSPVSSQLNDLSIAAVAYVLLLQFPKLRINTQTFQFWPECK